MKTLLALALICLSLEMKASPCGFYLFGGGGVSSSNNIQVSGTYVASDFSVPYDATLISANLTGSADVGIGYNFTPWLGLQGDFVYWGSQDYGVVYQFPEVPQSLASNSRTWSYGVEVVGYLPLYCDTLNPFVKVGYARFQSDWTFTSNTGIAISDFPQFTNNGNALVFGGGCAFAVNSSLDLTFQGQALYTDLQDVIDSHVTLWQFSVNLVYHFGDLCCW